jgi:hypothetical protein
LETATAELPHDISGICREESRMALLEQLSIEDENPEIRQTASKLIAFIQTI